MPRQNRRVPDGMNRFNYWIYEVACPWSPVSFTKPTAAQIVHEYCQKEFGLMLVGQSQEPTSTIATRRTSLKVHLGRFVTNPRVFALGFYIVCDKLWQEDSHAWTVKNNLPAGAQRKLLALDRKWWRYRSRWTWPVLLQLIARDQEVFRQVLALRPARAGLTGSWTKVNSAMTFKWRSYRYKPDMALKVYRTYRRQLTPLLKTGLSQQETHHWFAHALRNLGRYRVGHAPMAYTPSCKSTCHRRQQKLC